MHRENVHRQEVSNSSIELIFSIQVSRYKIISVYFIIKLKQIKTSTDLVKERTMLCETFFLPKALQN